MPHRPVSLPVTRRVLLGCAGLALAAALPIGVAHAQDAAAGFVKQFADQLVQVVNGPGSLDDKRQKLVPIIDGNVAVDQIARFCLGRFWHQATPEQQTKYTQLFRQVLLNNIAGHLGEYKGVSYTMGSSQTRGTATYVSTTITRPNNPPAEVQWVVEQVGGSPKVVDVVAEGTSLRLTQRSDYSSYLERHGGSIDALLAALQRQLNAG
jgi:phospholipid transport system substrate-binding protein